VLDGKNLVAAVPTASGKSLIGYIAMLRAFKQHHKAMYIVPLRALAAEKHEELKLFEKIGVKVAVSTGDLDSKGENLGSADIIIATSEKADSLLRHNSSWIRELAVLVVDEIHLMNDAERGPTLEMVIAKLRKLVPNMQVIGLSATIKNSEQIAEWLDAEHVISEWRPVILKYGTYCEGEIFFTNNERRRIEVEEDDLWALIEDATKDGGQALVFVNTRRSTETTALKYRGLMMKMLGGENEQPLTEAEQDEDGDEPTEVGNLLTRSLESGIAFHHAGLTSKQRTRVERMFKERKIRCLVATPTLAAGINLPARTVIIRDIYRYDSQLGNTLIPVMEIKQMLGRAGRPKYDKHGEAIILSRNREQASLILEEYLLGEVESVNSQIGNEKALRNNVLSAVATRLATSVEEMHHYFSLSFYAFVNDVEPLREGVEAALAYLEENGMVVTEGGSLRATAFGKRVSDLYIDPMSAVILKEALGRFRPGMELGFLHSVCSTPDMMPLFCRTSEIGEFNDIAEGRKKELIHRIDDADDPGLYLSQLKTAMLLLDWVGEDREETILERYNVYPGDLRNKAETAKWLVSSAAELASLLSSDATQPVSILAMRLEKGVTERLLDISLLKNIGRTRALALYTHNFRSRKDIASADIEKLSLVPGIGRNIAEKIISQAKRAKKSVVQQKETIPEDWFFHEE
jgi:helicase